MEPLQGVMGNLHPLQLESSQGILLALGEELEEDPQLHEATMFYKPVPKFKN